MTTIDEVMMRIGRLERAVFHLPEGMFLAPDSPRTTAPAKVQPTGDAAIIAGQGKQIEALAAQLTGESARADAWQKKYADEHDKLQALQALHAKESS